MDEQAVRVSVIGCGYWGKNLVRNLHQLGSLYSVYDSEEACSLRMSSTYGVGAAHNLEELLQESKVQAVAIAAPASLHFEIARKALLAGKDVFVEKPLAIHLEEGQELVELARKCGRILMVGHLLQYHPAIIELKRLIRTGELGKVQYIYSSRLNLGKLRTEENILWSFAPHDVSAILALLDEQPTAVAAQGESYLNHNIVDVTLTTLNFASGVSAHIFVSWLHPFKEQKLVIVGDHKMAVFDDTEPERKLTVYQHRIDWIDRVPVARKAEGEVVPLKTEEPLRSECQHFLECVRERKKPRTDGEEGLRVLRVLQACEKSLRSQGLRTPVEARTPSYFTHPTAVIDEPCEIGEGTKIWHFAHVMANSRIGKRCNLGQNVLVASSVRIGDNVKIQNNVSVYAGVELEDNVFCGPSMVFTNVINPRSHIVRKHEYQRTLVKQGASMGANSTILCGVTIGQYAFVGAGAVVTHDVPDYALVVGVPAKQVGWMCSCGTRLVQTGTSGECPACGQKFSIGGNKCTEAIATVSRSQVASS